MKKLLTLKNAADQYSISVRVLRTYALTGKMQASKIGKGWYVRPESIEKLIEEGANGR